ncbi:spidroin-2-like isoform X3 [Hyalella azteca]|uniref:Spidroin-2-like isoform X3 n=1 Tax=Hyalella azteca TaxID=294128 RepID=A0A979FJE8_HYAAZ|nr:spidroin-2-like isoform X3 [Hyalella azteca]
MMKSVGVVLLLTATFAYSGVEGANGCAKYLNNMLKNADVKTSFPDCMSDPAGQAALTALAGNPDCKGYKFITHNHKCEVLAAPFMKCVAGKIGVLNAAGSIDNTKILAEYTEWAKGPGCDAAQFGFGVKKCGMKIKNYAFLKKAACIARESKKYTAQSGPAQSGAGPAQTGPAQAGPAQSGAGPAQAGSAQAGPAQAGPAQAGPAQSGAGPAQSGAGPAQSGAGPAQAGPAQAGAGPAQAGPGV